MVKSRVGQKRTYPCFYGLLSNRPLASRREAGRFRILPAVRHDCLTRVRIRTRLSVWKMITGDNISETRSWWKTEFDQVRQLTLVAGRICDGERVVNQ